MNIDVGLAEDTLAEAVVANELAKSASDAAPSPHPSCANCGAGLKGAFCHQCGQTAHIHRSLLHLVEELLHGLLHFETKAWRTIPLLLFRPGKLTRDYIDGKRTRYVSPLALLLFLIFMMFFVFSLTSADTASPEGVAQELVKERAKLVRLQDGLAKLPAGDADRLDMEAGIIAQRSQIASLEKTAQSLEVKPAAGAATEAGAASVPDGKDPAPRLTQEKLHVQLSKHVPLLARLSIERKIIHAMDNKELAFYKIKGAAAKFAFLLAPISLPFLWLLFPFSRRFTMFDHAVFALYSLSAMAVLMMTAAVLGYFDLDAMAGLLITLAPPLHMFSQLRGSYALSRWSAAWRALALVFIACSALAIYSLVVVLLSM
ncbi:DUF3667 domain-containing protein [soil metagenome]